MPLLRTITHIASRLRIDVHRKNVPTFSHSPRRPHCEPARSSSDIGDSLSLCDAQNVNDAIDLQTLISPGRIENGEIPCVRLAGLTVFARRFDWGLSGTLSGGKSWVRSNVTQYARATFDTP